MRGLTFAETWEVKNLLDYESSIPVLLRVCDLLAENGIHEARVYYEPDAGMQYNATYFDDRCREVDLPDAIQSIVLEATVFRVQGRVAEDMSPHDRSICADKEEREFEDAMEMAAYEVALQLIRDPSVRDGSAYGVICIDATSRVVSVEHTTHWTNITTVQFTRPTADLPPDALRIIERKGLKPIPDELLFGNRLRGRNLRSTVIDSGVEIVSLVKGENTGKEEWSPIEWGEWDVRLEPLDTQEGDWVVITLGEEDALVTYDKHEQHEQNAYMSLNLITGQMTKDIK